MTDLAWTCAACKFPAASEKENFVTINMRDVQDAEEADRNWTAAHTDSDGSVSSTMDDLGPAPAHWKVFHGRCAPEDSAADYWFSLDRCATTDQLLMWTLHLMEKTWLRATDWDAFAESVARESGVSGL